VETQSEDIIMSPMIIVIIHVQVTQLNDVAVSFLNHGHFMLAFMPLVIVGQFSIIMNQTKDFTLCTITFLKVNPINSNGINSKISATFAAQTNSCLIINFECVESASSLFQGGGMNMCQAQSENLYSAPFQATSNDYWYASLSMTGEMCAISCLKYGFIYAALNPSNGQQNLVSTCLCNNHCPGNKDQMCGVHSSQNNYYTFFNLS
jgi:hypothetical protein